MEPSRIWWNRSVRYPVSTAAAAAMRMPARSAAVYQTLVSASAHAQRYRRADFKSVQGRRYLRLIHPAPRVWCHALKEDSMTPLTTDAPRYHDSPDDGLSTFLRVRPRLFGIAYRMLGSAAEAEDIVQDVWVRWQTADRSVVRDAAALLATTTTRLAINVMQSARSRRRRTSGPGCRSRSTRAPTLGWERNEARRWSWESWYCWRRCHPRNELRTSFERRSTMHTVTSRTSFGLKRPTRGKW